MAISIPFTADSRQFKKGLGTMRKDAGKFKTGLTGMFKKAIPVAMGNMMTRGIGMLKTGMSQMLKDADRIGKLATRLDMTAESIQRLGFIATQSGGTVELFAKGLTQAARVMGDKDNIAAAEAMDLLGISAEKFLALDAVGQLAMLGEAFNNSAEGGGRLQAMSDLIGMSFKEMLPALRLGGDGIKNLGDSIRVMSEATVRSTEAMNDAIDKVSTTVKNAAFDSIFEGIGDIQSLITGQDSFFDLANQVPEDKAKIKAMQKELDRRKAAIAAGTFVPSNKVTGPLGGAIMGGRQLMGGTSAIAGPSLPPGGAAAPGPLGDKAVAKAIQDLLGNLNGHAAETAANTRGETTVKTSQ